MQNYGLLPSRPDPVKIELDPLGLNFTIGAIIIASNMAKSRRLRQVIEINITYPLESCSCYSDTLGLFVSDFEQRYDE